MLHWKLRYIDNRTVVISISYPNQTVFVWVCILYFSFLPSDCFQGRSLSVLDKNRLLKPQQGYPIVKQHTTTNVANITFLIESKNVHVRVPWRHFRSTVHLLLLGKLKPAFHNHFGLCKSLKFHMYLPMHQGLWITVQGHHCKVGCTFQFYNHRYFNNVVYFYKSFSQGRM